MTGIPFHVGMRGVRFNLTFSIASILFLLTVSIPPPLFAQGARTDDALVVQPNDSVSVVVDLALAAEDMGLEESAVRSNCEERLRHAMIPILPDSSNTPAHTLYVNINIIGQNTTISLAFAKLVPTTIAGVQYLRRVTTWTDNAEGPHNKSPEIILAGLMNSLDKFVTEFLRANQHG